MRWQDICYNAFVRFKSDVLLLRCSIVIHKSLSYCLVILW